MERQPTNPWPATAEHLNDRSLPRGTDSLASAAEADHKPGLVGWVFMGLLMSMVAFFVWRQTTQELGDESPTPEAALGQISTNLEEALPIVAEDKSDLPSFLRRFAGELRDDIQLNDIEVADGQGVLVLKGYDPQEIQDVQIDGKPVEGDAVALQEGQHEIRYTSQGKTHQRFYFVPAGKTRVAEF